MCDDVCMWTAGYQHETIQIRQDVFFSCESPFCAPYLNSMSMSFDFVSYNLPRARTRNIKLIQTHSNLCIYIYTIIYILYQLYTYSPNPFGKNNYTRLHPLTLCPGVGFLWLLHQQSAGEDAGYAGNTWGCRPPKMGSMHEKKTKHLSQLSQTSFCQDFAALSWSFSPMWSISWDQEASMPWFQAENHPFIPPIHDMEKPNTSAWHIFWYMFIYI